MHAQRILVAGASGSGKTTFARRLAAVSGIAYTEIDALHWRAGWTSSATFVDDVERLVAQDAWITELQYGQVQALLASRAELIVRLRPPRLLVLLRVVRRTLRRRFRKEVLWGVNVEPPLRTILVDRDHIVRYSVRSHRIVEERIRAALLVDPAIRVVEVRSRRDADRLLGLLHSERR